MTSYSLEDNDIRQMNKREKSVYLKSEKMIKVSSDDEEVLLHQEFCIFTKDEKNIIDLPPGSKARLKAGKIILLGEPELAVEMAQVLAVNFGLETKQNLSKKVTYFRLWKIVQNCLLLIFRGVTLETLR